MMGDRIPPTVVNPHAVGDPNQTPVVRLNAPEPLPAVGPEALAAQREALVERLAEGHWRLDWPNQSYPWPEENPPTADTYRRGARRCLDGIALAGLRLVPADTEPSDAEQAAAWMHEAWHQAAERDRQCQRAETLAAELAKTISNFEEHAEVTAEQLADARHEIEVLRRINRELNDGNADLNQLVLDAQRERDEARAALERERTEHAQWSFEAGRQAGEFIRGLQEQAATRIAELKAATIAARRFAVSDELLGRLGSHVGAEPVEVDP